MRRLHLLFGRTFPAAIAANPKAEQAMRHGSVRAVGRFGRAHQVILASGMALACLALVTPTPALAWWSGGVWMGGPAYAAPRYAYVPPPPVYYGPPPFVYGPPVTRWIPGHYNWHGFWVPGHWVG